MTLVRGKPIFERTAPPALSKSNHKTPLKTATEPPSNSPQPASKPGKPDPDEWLYWLQKTRAPVDVHLMTGEIFAGAVITEVSRYEITVRLRDGEVHLLKHALAWIRQPSGKDS